MKQRKSVNRKNKKIILIVLAFLFVGIILIMVYIPKAVLGKTLNGRVERALHSAEEFELEIEEVWLQTEDGLQIYSWFVEAPTPKGTVIILSGIENPSVTAFGGYARALKEEGYHSLLIEMRAHNLSEGDRVYLGMKEWLDVKAGIEYLMKQSRSKDLPMIVMGTSMGGATALVSAGEIGELDGVIAISPYSSFSDTFYDNMNRSGSPEFFSKLEKPFVDLYLGLQYGFQDFQYSPMNSLSKMNKQLPVLLMHSTEDSQIPIESFYRLKNRAQEEGLNFSTFVREGDHHFMVYDEFFKSPEKDQEFMSTIINFLEDNF